MHRDQFACTVRENVALCREHFRLVLTLPEFPATEPGQFIQLSCRNLDHDFNPDHQCDWEPGDRLTLQGHELLAPLSMLRRPFSLAGRRNTPGGMELDIIHRVVGVGTDWLSHLKVGDRAFILGPLGNRFTLPPKDGMAILVGGGVGIPPMLYLAEKLTGMRAVAFCGALSRDLLPLTIRPGAPIPTTDSFTPLASVEEFARHGVDSVISTDDGSYGFRGFVTQALERFLDAMGFTASESRQGDTQTRRQGDEEIAESPRPRVPASSALPQSSVLNPQSSPILYTCGPEPMMKRVADIAASRSLACQIAVERAMACGMGTCQSCVIRVAAENQRGWVYKLACTDGPVFEGTTLRW
jgi:dihydroorotate dehydrogenase electron transfer subunit